MFELKVKEEENENFIIKTALIKFNETTEEIYVKLPISEKAYLTDLLDPFVIMSIYKMMKVGGKCYIRGKVSSSLLDNLENFCNCWIVWRPDLYKPIEIIADEEINDVPKRLNNDAITCFSGGLDSCFTVYSHYKKLAGRNNKNIKKAIMIHGADIPLENKEEFDIAFNSSKKILDDINIPLVAVETNYRKYGHNWEMEFISLIAFVLNMYLYKYILISSDQTVKNNLIWSSNSISNSYLSTSDVDIITYGEFFTRTEKANIIKDFNIALENMRVCWQGEDKSKNCGVCEKCQRTILNFKVCGINEIKCLGSNIDLSSLYLMNKTQIKYFQEILDYNKKTNYLDKMTVEKIEKLIKKSERRLKLKDKKIYDILNKMAWWIPVKKWRDNFRNLI